MKKKCITAIVIGVFAIAALTACGNTAQESVNETEQTTGAGTEQDYAQAMEQCKKAADLGEASAMENIGYFYENGLGVQQEFIQLIYCPNHKAMREFLVIKPQ